MNRVMPSHHRQQQPRDATRDATKLNQDERQLASPTPIVQNLLFLKESDIQLPDTELPNEPENSSPRKSDREDEIESRRKSEQPVFKVKNTEPSPQFYYQHQAPTVIQQEYVYHTQKEDPAYMMRHKFIPVHQQNKHKPPPQVAPKPTFKRVYQNHTFTTQDSPLLPQKVEAVYQRPAEAIYQRPSRFSAEPALVQPSQKPEQQSFTNYDDYLSRADILYPAENPAKQIDRIPLKDAPGDQPEAPIEPVEVFPQSKPPTPPPLPPAAVSTPSSTFTSRGDILL